MKLALYPVLMLVSACLYGRDQSAGSDDSPFGFLAAGIDRAGYTNIYGDATNIGVRMCRDGTAAAWRIVQPDLSSSVYNFDQYDAQWMIVPTNMSMVGNIEPEWEIQTGRCLTNSWVPVNITQYEAFVKAVVERYDGDGYDDMRNLNNPIKYWQVGNEPYESIRANFSTLQRITYGAIKAADPNATVLIGGFLDVPRSYTSHFDTEYAPILQQLGGQYVDILDFHWVGTAGGDYRFVDTKNGSNVVAHVRAKLREYGFSDSVPIWCTEMSTYSGDPSGDYPYQTERQQAADCLKHFIYGRWLGIEKMFPAFGMLEGYGDYYDNNYYDNTGFIYDGIGPYDLGFGVKKLVYYTYKRMTETLGQADWGSLTKITSAVSSNYVHVFGINVSNQPVQIAWWDVLEDPAYTNGARQFVHITGFTGTVVSVQSAIAQAAAGIYVTNYPCEFPETHYSVINGASWVEIGEDPVYIRNDPGEPENLEIPMAGDFDGDRRADFVVFVNGQWIVWLSGDSYAPVGPLTLSGGGGAAGGR